MPKKVRSAKGEIVDFDLMKIKQQLGESAEPTNVQARQDFIDQKMRRRLKKVKSKLAGAKLRGHEKPKAPEPVDVDKNVKVQSPVQAEKLDEVVKSDTGAPKKVSKTKRKIKKKAPVKKSEE